MSAPRSWLLPTVVGLAVLLVAGGIGAGRAVSEQQRQLEQLRAERAELREELARLEARRETLEEADRGGGASTGRDGLSEGLVQELLEGLLEAEDGPLGGLLDDADGLLDGLLDGDLFDLDVDGWFDDEALDDDAEDDR